MLKSAWGITGYQELLETVAYMTRGPGFTSCREQGERAWQLSRASSLLGMAMVLDWASRRELVERSRRVCQQIQGQFSSWDEFYLAFLDHFSGAHHGEGAPNDKEAGRHRVDCYWELKKHSDGLYSLPWDLALEG